MIWICFHKVREVHVFSKSNCFMINIAIVILFILATHPNIIKLYEAACYITAVYAGILKNPKGDIY